MTLAHGNRSWLWGLMAVLVSCSGPYTNRNVAAKEARPPVPVSVERAELAAIPEVIPANGELFAEEQATVGAKAPGRVRRFHVDLGSQVEAGQVLAELEPEDYEFRVRQADALVQQTRARLGILNQVGDDVTPEETAIVREAEAQRKEARLLFETTAQLQKEGVVSKIDFEKAGVRRQSAEAHYQAAVEEVMQLRAQLTERRAQLALARQNLADCAIRAPFSGAITRRHASLGEYLPVNAPVVLLVRQHPLRVRLEVPERQAAMVRPGQRIDIHVEGSAPQGSMTRSGRVLRLSPAIESQNRSLLIEGEIPNQDGVLRPGSFVQGLITVNAAARGIALAADSLLTFAGVERMLVVINGEIDTRMVRTGRRLPGERVEVHSGIAPGELVVRRASDRMTKGQKVTVR